MLVTHFIGIYRYKYVHILLAHSNIRKIVEIFISLLEMDDNSSEKKNMKKKKKSVTYFSYNTYI